jgi:Flp pilus assembly protein TadG
MDAMGRKLSVGRQHIGARSRRGAVFALFCISLIALTLAMGLAIDVGRLVVVRSELQTACDLAALAGAGNLSTPLAAQDAGAMWYLSNTTGGSTQPSGSGETSRVYTIGRDTVTVTTPFSDALTTERGWDPNDLVEVRTTRPEKMFFGGAVGLSTATVVTRAVALGTAHYTRGVDAGEGCLFALDQGFSINCNTFTLAGSLLSNGAVSLNLNTATFGDTVHAKTSVTMNGNKLNGHFTVEYGTTYSVNANHKDIAGYVKLPQEDITPPIDYDPTKYASDFAINYTYNGDTTITGNSYNPAPGVYYINGNFSINTNNADLSNCTFIVNGSFTCNTNNVTLSPSQNCMCVYLVGTGGTISMNQNNITLLGDLYAPNGFISCNSNNTHKGWWVARRITINCNTFNLGGIPGRNAGVLKLVE